jgi:branched-chain amino acid transport system substrate-binding protein
MLVFFIPLAAQAKGTRTFVKVSHPLSAPSRADCANTPSISIRNSVNRSSRKTGGRPNTLNLWSALWLCVAQLLTVVWSPLVVQAEAAPAHLRVGFIGALSGPGAVYGISNRRGIEMALSDLGEQRVLDVTFEDDQFDNRKSVDALKRLIAEHQVDVIVTLGSSVSNATAPIAQAHGIPFISWASDPKVSHGRPLVVRSCPSGQFDGRAAAQEARVRGLKTVVTVATNSDYPNSVVEGFRAEAPATGPWQDVAFEGTERDFRALLAKLKTKSIDGVFLCLAPGQLGLFARQLREQGISSPLFGCETLDDDNEIAVAPAALEGAWYVTTAVNAEFQERYKRSYGETSVIGGAAVQYDIITRLNEAARSGARGEALLQKLLTSADRPGAVGISRFVVDSEDRYLEVPRVVKIVAPQSK